MMPTMGWVDPNGDFPSWDPPLVNLEITDPSKNYICPILKRNY